MRISVLITPHMHQEDVESFVIHIISLFRGQEYQTSLHLVWESRERDWCVFYYSWGRAEGGGVLVNMSELLLLELLTVPKEGAPDFFFFFFNQHVQCVAERKRWKVGFESCPTSNMESLFNLLDTSPLLDKWFTGFLPFCGLSFQFLDDAILSREVFNFDEAQLLFFCSCSFLCDSKKPLP